LVFPSHDQDESALVYSVEGGYLYDGNTFNTFSDACVVFKDTVDRYRRDK